LSVLSCIYVYGWCTQTQPLIPYDLKRSCPVMLCDVYVTRWCRVQYTAQ